MEIIICLRFFDTVKFKNYLEIVDSKNKTFKKDFDCIHVHNFEYFFTFSNKDIFQRIIVRWF